MEVVGSLDIGTSSVRFILFDKNARQVASHQLELQNYTPEEGYFEQNPMEYLEKSRECIEKSMKKVGIPASAVKAIGVANQRETTLVWNRITGEPLYNSIVWLDTRTRKIAKDLIERTSTRQADHFQRRTGLPVSTYFSALKLRWLLDHVPQVRRAYDDRSMLFGTVDTWIIYNLTGGSQGGVHVTDVTNASRTMLMNLELLAWDDEMCKFFDIDPVILPELRSSSEIYGYIVDGILKGVPIAGCLGDQQAALIGHGCFSRGDAKSTYGTGCFMVYNTGEHRVFSSRGLLTTVAYQLGFGSKPCYALEGSIAVAGAAIEWLRDNLGLIDSPQHFDTLASSVPDTSDVYFVPAFSGLFAPYWRPDARGLLIGLTQHVNKAHICRALLEAVAFQTREIVDAIESDSHVRLNMLSVDGGMTRSKICMQIQADLLGIEVEVAEMKETTALGAAFVSGLAVGFWKSIDDPGFLRTSLTRFVPNLPKHLANGNFERWKDAVNRSFGWLKDPESDT